MKKSETIALVCILIAIIFLFFHQVFIFGKVPFPGDILTSDYQPWRSSSYLGYNAGGIPTKAQYPDTIRQIYPWKTLVITELKKGNLPLWNPYNFSGTPLLANFQSAALYPLNVVYLLFTQIHAWTALIILQPALALFFTYLYCRTLGIKSLGAAMSSLSYGFSGFMAVWLEYNSVGHVIMWLPLVLYCIEKNREKSHPLTLLILTFVQAASLLAGHPQIYAYMFIFTTIYSIVRIPKAAWLKVIGFSLLGIGTASIQLIPGVELLAHAARSPHDFDTLFTKILIQPLQLLSLPFPNFFGNPATRTYWPDDTFVGKVTTIGLIPLFFILSAFRRTDTVTKFFILSSIALTTLISANPITWFLYRIPVPLITSSSPTLMAFLLAFSLSMTCGLGLDYWMIDKHSIKKIFRRSLEIAILLTILFLCSRVFTHWSVAGRAILYAGILSSFTMILFGIAVKITRFRKHALLALLVIHTLDLFIFFHRFNPFVSKELVFPQHDLFSFLQYESLNRYWGYGTASIAANFATQYQIFSPEGYDPLYPKWYGEFLYSYKNRKLLEKFDNSTRSDAAIESHFGDGGLSDKDKLKVLSTLSVYNILNRVENNADSNLFPPDYIHKSHDYGQWSVYSNTLSTRRVYLVNSFQTYTSRQDFNNIFFSDSFNPQHTVLLEKEPGIIPSITSTGSAQIVTYEPNQIRIRTRSQAPSILVVSDTYYPGWKAAIDENEPVEILRANWTQRALVIPAGEQIVTMTYKPNSVKIGIFFSIISILISLIWYFRIKRTIT